MKEYTFGAGSPGNKRFKIGFLDENLNDDYHSQVMMGISKAAKELGVDFIRFGYYSSDIAYKFSNQIDLVLEHIEQYELDGLLFLGWTRAGAMYNHENFTKRFKSIPVLSIGTEYDDIPSVFFPGNSYVHEITLHLINVHNLRKIAYIEHFRPDNRNGAYIGAMIENSVYDPELFVSNADLAGYQTPERAIRAIEILLDERKLEPDAIISLTNFETLAILKELETRGINVPKDIAVVSYEETEAWKYTSPGVTTAYFPWMELGYNACIEIIELLKNGHILHTTYVPGKILFRDSCGCTPHSIEIADAPGIRTSGRPLSGITRKDRDRIAGEMDRSFPTAGMDFEAILGEFLQSCKVRDGSAFLRELGRQFRKVPAITYSFNLEDIVSYFRRLLLPYIVAEAETLPLWAGTLFQQAQVLACDRTSAIQSFEMLNAKLMDQSLQEISQELISSFNLQNLAKVLEKSLQRLNIGACRVFVSSSLLTDEEDTGDLFGNCVLLFDYRNGVRKDTAACSPSSARDLLSGVLSPDRPAATTLAYLLHVADEIMGFALFEPGPMDERVYQVLSMHISSALRGSMLVDKLDDSYKKLVRHAQREGMADIATDILHNIGNILNSINVSADAMDSAVKNGPFDDLARANRLLGDNMERLGDFISSDKKGKMLMQYYMKLGYFIARFSEKLHYNANRLELKLNSVNELIAAQQSYAGVSSQPEELNIIAILEDALKVHSASLDKYRVTVERDYRANPRLTVQRARLFYIFSNLINNARDSMSDVPPDERKLTVSVFEKGGESCVRISDTGRGIAGEAIEKVFEYGYAIKNEGHGFGLHSSFSYMREMGGTILAENSETGKGETFTVIFGQKDAA